MLLKTIKFVIQLLFRVEINGEYLGGKQHGCKKTLIIANHSSFLDGILLAAFLPEKPVFVVHRESTNSYFFKLFLRSVEYLKVDPEHPMAMRRVINVLNTGKPLVIFPEGRVTVTGSLMKLYAGAAFAALKTQATIIPVQISGAQYSYFSRLRQLFNLSAFPKLRLTIFPPTKITVDDALPYEDRREQGKEQMHQLMMNMIVESREKTTLFEMLLASRKVHGSDKLAYQDELGDELNYGDFVKKSVSLSVLFRRRLNAFDKQKRIGLMLPNSNAGVLVFYALIHSAKTPVMINYTAGSRAIIAGLVATEVDTILTSKRFIKKGELDALIADLGDYRIVYLEDLRKQVTTSDKLTILTKRYFPKQTLVKQTANDEAVVLFTSGTEGLPKGVVHSHDSLMTNVAQIKAIFDFTPQDKFMACLPTFHVFGLMGANILPLTLGSSTFLYPSPLHYRTVPERIYEYGCTVLYSTSTFLAGYARFAEQYDMHGIRYIIAGAEKLSPEVMKTYYEKFGVRIIEGYGATEAAPVIAANTPMANRLGTVGFLIPGIESDVVPVEGIQSGGKLVIRADNIMLGYLRADKPGVLERPPVVNGKRVHDTGDIIDYDQDGFMYLKGRVKRFAKLAGEMISLDTVEQMAIQASPDNDHAVISVVEKRKGEQLVLLTTDTKLTRRRLQQTSKQMNIPKLAVPKIIKVIDEVPVFSNGKTNYPELSALYETLR